LGRAGILAEGLARPPGELLDPYGIPVDGGRIVSDRLDQRRIRIKRRHPAVIGKGFLGPTLGVQNRRQDAVGVAAIRQGFGDRCGNLTGIGPLVCPPVDFGQQDLQVRPVRILL
jgi:hypothetical protein